MITMTLFVLPGMDLANAEGRFFGDMQRKKHELTEEKKNKHTVLSEPDSTKPDTATPTDMTDMQTERRKKQAEGLREMKGDQLVDHMLTQGDACIQNPTGILSIGIKSHNNIEEIVDCIEPVNKPTFTFQTYERILHLNIFHQPEIKKKRCVRKIKRCTSVFWHTHALDDPPSCNKYRWIENAETRIIELHQDCSICGWPYYDSYIDTVQSERTELRGESWQMHDPHKLVARVKNNECSVVKTEAIRGRNTEYHYGVGFTRDLWHQRITVMCPDPLSHHPNPCLDLRKKGCLEISHKTRCLKYGNDGQCSSYAKQYRCPVHQESTINAGTNGIHCIGGGNLVKQYEKYDDMAEALTYLNVINQMQKEVKDWNNAEIFKGHSHKCKKNILENLLYDCCASLEGFAISLCLTNCNAEEKELAKQKAEGRCHYVGSIQNEIIGLIHSSDSQVYCCFDSKLMAILQKEARKQLRKGFGTPKAPDCKGLTIAEIGQLDFSKMDLSELFDDVVTAAKNKSAGKIDPTAMKERIETKFKDLQKKRQAEDKPREEEKQKTIGKI